jgi:hypothetical protein
MLAEEIVKEINLIPTNKLREVYDFIHYFRIGVEQSQQVYQNNLSALWFKTCRTPSAVRIHPNY